MDNTIAVTIDDKNKNLTTIVYGLYAVGVFFPVLLIAAVIVNYVKKADVAGTMYESHFAWQIRTFWISLVVGLIGLVTLIVGIGVLVIIGNGIWILYRIIKGFLRLNDGKPV